MLLSVPVVALLGQAMAWGLVALMGWLFLELSFARRRDEDDGEPP